MRIYISDIRDGYFKIGNDAEVVSSINMCKETTLPNPKKSIMGKLFNKDIKKCIPFLYIEVERQMPLGNSRLTMHPTIFAELLDLLKKGSLTKDIEYKELP